MINETGLNNLTRKEKIQLARALFEIECRRKVRPLNFFVPQDYQKDFWKSSKKLLWIFGGNRSGKTVNGSARTVKFMEENPKSDLWAVTWSNLSVPVQQKRIYEFLPKDKIDYCKYTEQSGFANRVVTLNNGSILRFKTYDQDASSFQGTDKDFIWNDEEPPEDIFREEQARLIDRDGVMLTTMTAIKGMTWTYNFVFESDPAIKALIDYWFWNSFDNKKINREALKNIIGTYGKKEAEVRSTGAFVNINSGVMFYAFDRLVHKKKLSIDPDRPIRLCFDFNVNPMTTSICQIVAGDPARNEQRLVLNVLETINTNDCNTIRQCQILKKKLKDWNGRIIIYGDASNPRRTETADVNETNWIHVQRFFPDAEYKIPNVNPNIKERVSWLNAKLINYNNQIGLYVNEKKCDPLIRDFERVIWSPDGLSKSKKNPELTHNSDNIEYLIAQEFQLTPEAFGTSDSY